MALKNIYFCVNTDVHWSLKTSAKSWHVRSILLSCICLPQFSSLYYFSLFIVIFLLLKRFGAYHHPTTITSLTLVLSFLVLRLRIQQRQSASTISAPTGQPLALLDAIELWHVPQEACWNTMGFHIQSSLITKPTKVNVWNNCSIYIACR